MQVQGVTVSVSDLSRSRRFYEEVLGFVPDAYYEPTRWQCYKFDGRAYFAITEVPEFQRNAASDIVNFGVQAIESLWDRVRDKVEVEAELAETPGVRTSLSSETRMGADWVSLGKSERRARLSWHPKPKKDRHHANPPSQRP